MISQLIKAGFTNAIKLCLDELPREPQRILIIGGCRQRDFAQYMALLLPAVEIFILDPDAEQVAKAKEEICCRFKFIHAPVEAMPFEKDFFDFTMGHHLFEYVEQWEPAMAEIGRVTFGHFMFSTPRPVIWALGNKISAVREALKAEGLTFPTQTVALNAILTHLNRYAKIRLLLSPIFWNIYMTVMKPFREERLILTPETTPELVSAS